MRCSNADDDRVAFGEPVAGGIIAAGCCCRRPTVLVSGWRRCDPARAALLCKLV